MKVLYQTYVDHQQIIKFPVSLLKKRHDNLLVYVSDHEQSVLLSDYKPIIINHKINVPKDISIAQNKCVEHTLCNMNPDFVVHVQADIFITSAGFDLIQAFCGPHNLEKSAHLRVQHVRLGMIADRTHFGAAIIGKNCNHRFIGDGAYLDSQNIIGNFDGVAPCYDIGYLTHNQYRNHIRRHSITWPENINASGMTNEDIAKYACNRHYKAFKEQGYKWFRDMPESHIVLDGMNIVSEYSDTETSMRYFVTHIWPVSIS